YIKPHLDILSIHDSSTSAFYTLSLHDALPIFDANTLSVALTDGSTDTVTFDNAIIATGSTVRLLPGVQLSENVVTFEEQILTRRSEEHTSELQSRENLVCRLLLEKKKRIRINT